MSFPCEPDVQVCRFGRGVRDDQCQEGNGNTWYGPSCCFAVSISGESCPPLWKRVCATGEKMMSCTTGHPMSAVPTTCSPMSGVASERVSTLFFGLPLPRHFGEARSQPGHRRVRVRVWSWCLQGQRPPPGVLPGGLASFGRADSSPCKPPALHRRTATNNATPFRQRSRSSRLPCHRQGGVDGRGCSRRSSSSTRCASPRPRRSTWCTPS